MFQVLVIKKRYLDLIQYNNLKMWVYVADIYKKYIMYINISPKHSH